MTNVLTRLLGERDCARVVNALAVLAAELDQPTGELLEAMVEFWQRVPDTVDDRSLAVWAARFSWLLEPNHEAGAGRLPALTKPVLSPVFSGPGSRISRGHRKMLAGDRTSRETSFTTVRQIADILEAASAAPQLSGETFTACLTFNHELLGHRCHDEAVAMVGRLMKDLSAITARRRPGRGTALHRISFISRPPDGDLQSTVLLALPDFLIEPAGRWLSLRCLPDHADASSHAQAPFRFDAEYPRTGRGRMNRHWDLVRRLWTGVDPEAMVDGEYLFVRLGLTRRQLAPAGLMSGRRYNLSQTITPEARRNQALQGMPLLSAWHDRAWNSLFGGWELDEHRDREAEVARRAAQIAELENSYRHGTAALDEIALANRIRIERASWAWNAYDRRHSWRTWW